MMAKIVERYLEDFEKVKQAALDEPAWLRFFRDESVDAFARKGFPTAKDDAWRYTDLGHLTADKFSTETEAPRAILSDVGSLKRGLSGYFLFFHNGRFRPEFSALPAGVRARNMSDLLAEEPELEPGFRSLLQAPGEVFLDLNMALGLDGVVIEVPDGFCADCPIHVIHCSDVAGRLFQPRTIVMIGRGARAVLIEDYRGEKEKKYLTNAFTGVVLQEKAVLEHYKVQQESRSAFHVANLKVEQKKGSLFSSCSVALGSELTRQEISVTLAEEEAGCRLSGLYLGEGRQHFDHVTWVDHAKPSGKSRQLFKGVLGGDARGVFTGRILVRPGAQKTDAHQTSKNLLLSGEAKADVRPQLEILTDDVKCSHGSAIGESEEDAVFYLRSRGIDERSARKILAEGFAMEILEHIREPQWKKYTKELVSEKLAKIGAGGT